MFDPKVRDGKIPTGKGMFIWLLYRLCDKFGGAEGLVEQLVAEGYKWATVKIQQSTKPFRGAKVGDFRQQELIGEFKAACEKHGLEFHAWGYVYGKDLLFRSIVNSEAAMTLQMIAKWKPLSFIINDEEENRGDRRHLADSYIRQVLTGMAVTGDNIPDIPLGMSSHRFPEVHRKVPYSGYAEYIDFWAPQVYYQGDTRPDGSEQQLLKSLAQYDKIRADIPYVPAGTLYPEGLWMTSPDQLRLFNKVCKENEKIVGVNYWEYHYLLKEPELTQVMAEFDWPSAQVEKEPEAEAPEDLKAFIKRAKEMIKRAEELLTE
jgi:hypothetical protein